MRLRRAGLGTWLSPQGHTAVSHLSSVGAEAFEKEGEQEWGAGEAPRHRPQPPGQEWAVPRSCGGGEPSGSVGLRPARLAEVHPTSCAPPVLSTWLSWRGCPVAVAVSGGCVASVPHWGTWASALSPAPCTALRCSGPGCPHGWASFLCSLPGLSTGYPGPKPVPWAFYLSPPRRARNIYLRHCSPPLRWRRGHWGP